MQKLIEKIKKLLALSVSSNENEAAIAAQKAQELLVLHNLEISDLSDSDNEILEVDIEESGKIYDWKLTLSHGVAIANSCKSLKWNYRGKGAKLVFYGNKTNTMICQHLYEYLVGAIQNSSKEHKGKGTSYLNSFKVGCANRLAHRLIEKRNKMKESGVTGTSDTPSVPAIVVRSMFEKQEGAVNEYVKNIGMPIKLVSTLKESDLLDTKKRSAMSEGYKAADKINLHQQINPSNSRELKRLGTGN